ncbi:calcium-binding protein [Thermococcus pacificus]|uniref:Calcium-binding protein n=1 Tax=Thermococcus pacificus TaxID=71998 RepID=A0A218P5G9_9EURY|nr:calcium-binding protein [Thermococcus pacificus]ASJ06034.1 calcium-binding protein [Thermococcus pacificus]
MGKLTVLIVLLLLIGLYVYYTNPHIIDDLTRGVDDFRNGSPGSGGDSGRGTQTETQTGAGSGGSFGGTGWVANNTTGSPEVYIGDNFAAVPVNSSYILFADRNKDGKIDAVYMDTTGDGNYDTAYLDEDYNGKTDTWKTTFNGVSSYSWDVTGDGIPDVYDTNGDGKVDAWDLNSDGVIDERDVDYDGNPDLHDYNFDGVFDEFQTNVTFAPPESRNTSGTGAAGFSCPDNEEDAYRLYVQAYNNVTQLMAENQSSSDEAKRAYDIYLKARECYESFSSSTTSSSGPVTGTLGKIHRVTLDTDGAMAVKFSTGEVKASWTSGWEDVDLSAEPWCVDYPALLGHYVDIGEMSLDEVTINDIPSSGYPSSEVGEEVKAGHVYVNKNSDGTYTVFALVSHEKTGDCSHRITIAYRNVEG